MREYRQNYECKDKNELVERKELCNCQLTVCCNDCIRRSYCDDPCFIPLCESRERIGTTHNTPDVHIPPQFKSEHPVTIKTAYGGKIVPKIDMDEFDKGGAE